jgi:hypothetical protein
MEATGTPGFGRSTPRTVSGFHDHRMYSQAHPGNSHALGRLRSSSNRPKYPPVRRVIARRQPVLCIVTCVLTFGRSCQSTSRFHPTFCTPL